MSEKSDISPRRTSLLIFLTILVIVAFIFLIREMGNSTDFNNDRIVGNYEGAILIPDWQPINVSINFDGERYVSGTLNQNNET